MVTRAKEEPDKEKAVQLSLEERLVRVSVVEVGRPPVAGGMTGAGVTVTERTITATTTTTTTTPSPTTPTPTGGTAATVAGGVASAILPVPAPAPTAPRVFAVSELIRAARITLESRFADVRVEGEVVGLKRSGPGHLYFCLKDSEAQLDCVMFSREAQRLRFRVEEGMAVRGRGRLTIYEGRGKFQMSVSELEPTGAGALALAFEQLKKKLQAEGLFDSARKRPLPFLPRRLGVVSSSSGAVLHDIIRVAHRRYPIAILLAPTPVQGEGASLAIAAALRRLAAVPDVDVIILARGGGSLEDLWAFNEETVARAIVASRVPVISAVGHETDFTIADFAADVRAPTASAAAELAVPVAADLAAELTLLRRRATRGAEAELRGARLALERARTRLGDPRRLLDSRRQRVDELAERALQRLRRRLAGHHADLRAAEMRLNRAHPRRRIDAQRALLVGLRQALAASIARATDRRRRALEACTTKLGALSPLKVLDRGFSLTQDAQGHLVTRADQVHPGDAVTVRLREGTIEADVTATLPPAKRS
ncbi:MAG TPA: exodeoxyribonuclease VII large subunit [Polyangia bacterium]|nr:exodeoxyribonuclease VII large subunit [Polyangia bacterium]